MLALGLALNTLGIGLFCWLILALAVYALPFFVALSVGISAFSRWRGLFGALLIGIASGALTLAAGQLTLAVNRSLTLRVPVATVFAVPRQSPATMWCLPCPRSGCVRRAGGRPSLA